jgi:hypothetical protein
MTKNDAVAKVFEEVFDIQCVYKTDTDGTGFYDVTPNDSGHSINQFKGSDPEYVARRMGIYRLQFSDHGAGKKSVQAFGPKSELLADVTYFPDRNQGGVTADNFDEYFPLDYPQSLMNGVTELKDGSVLVTRLESWCKERGYSVSSEVCREVLLSFVQTVEA